MPLPTYDPISASNSATQVGALLAQTYMQNNLAYQRLRSEDALRRAEEARMAQETAFALDQHNRQIQYRADMDKAAGQFAVATASQGPPIVPVPVGMGPAGMPIMAPVNNPKYRDPVDVATDTFLPVIAKYEPEKVPAFLREQAYSKYMTGRGDVSLGVAGIRADSAANVAGIRAGSAENVARIRQAPRQLSPEESERIKAQTRLANARAEETERGRGGTPSNIEKELEYFKQQGVEFDPSDLDEVARVKLGLSPKPGTTRQPKSLEEFVDQNFMKAREREDLNPTGPPSGLLRRSSPLSDQELIDKLTNVYRASHRQQNSTKPASKTVRMVPPAGHKDAGKVINVPESQVEEALKRKWQRYGQSPSGDEG